MNCQKQLTRTFFRLDQDLALEVQPTQWHRALNQGIFSTGACNAVADFALKTGRCRRALLTIQSRIMP